MENNDSELTETQRAEVANQIYRGQLKYMQDDLASQRSRIEDKKMTIENLMLRYDLVINTQDSNRQSGDLSTDEIEDLEDMQRTVLENFERREAVNELRDENDHLRNEMNELVRSCSYILFYHLTVYCTCPARQAQPTSATNQQT